MLKTCSLQTPVHLHLYLFPAPSPRAPYSFPLFPGVSISSSLASSLFPKLPSLLLVNFFNSPIPIVVLVRGVVGRERTGVVMGVVEEVERER